MDVVLTCKGNFDDEKLDQKVALLKQHISSITESECSLLKVEPWNSIKVTFSIPKKAAKQLKELARSNSALLKDLDILTVQVEGEDTIKLASNPPQPLQQQLIPHNQNGMPARMFSSTGVPNMSPANAHLMQPGNPPPKKRRRTKEKQVVKANKVTQNRPASESIPDQVTVPNALPTTDILSQSSPQFSITQLSPSVEEIVSEAWDRELHPPEEDIMDVQLQSFSSGANVTTDASQSMLNPAFDQPNLHNAVHKQHSVTSDVLHVVQPELQKQQSVPNNFAPALMQMEQKVYAGQNVGSGLTTSNINQMTTQDPALFNQQISMQGGNQEISQPQQMVNMAANYPVNNLHASSSNQFTNGAMQWPPGSNVQQQQASMFKMQAAHNSSSNSFQIQQPSQSEIAHVSLAPQGNLMMAQSSVMTSQLNLASQNTNASQNALMMSHGGVITQGNAVSQGGFMASQSSLMTSQSSMMASHSAMSPAVSGHHQFPFSFPSPVKQHPQNIGDLRPDKLPVMGPNMSMDSPLLVNLLQTEPPPGMTSPGFPVVSVAGANLKPKRKKPAKKKKPSKSTDSTTPTGAGPMQAFGGVYGMQGQFLPQHFSTGDMTSPEHMMPQQMKMSSQDSKFIDAISRSDVGAQSAGFSNDGNLTSELHSSSQQMPSLRRHNSFPVSRSGSFPHGFDPSKPPFQRKQQPGLSPQQQQMYMSQMAGQYSGFKPGHSPRQMLVQGQQMQPQQGGGDGNQMQYQPSGYHHTNPPMPIMQQPARPPQRYPGHPRTPPQMQSPGGVSQPMAHQNRGMKAPGPLPTLPQQRSVRPQVVQSVSHRRPTRFVGRLTTGAMSVMMKSSCGAPTSEQKAAAFPTLRHTQQQIRACPQSAHARKSPGTSFESMSPKMSHPNTPSPHVQHQYGMHSPSPIAASGGKSTPSQSRPLSRNFPPANSVIRRPSIDQFGNVVVANPAARPLSNPAAPSPPVGGSVGVAASQNFPMHQAPGSSKGQENAQVPTELPQGVRHQHWTNPTGPLGSNPAQYLWKGQATVSTVPSVSSASGTNFPASVKPASGNQAPAQLQLPRENLVNKSNTPPSAGNPAPGAANPTPPDVPDRAASTTTNDASGVPKIEAVAPSTPAVEPQGTALAAPSAATA